MPTAKEIKDEHMAKIWGVGRVKELDLLKTVGERCRMRSASAGCLNPLMIGVPDVAANYELLGQS